MKNGFLSSGVSFLFPQPKQKANDNIKIIDSFLINLCTVIIFTVYPSQLIGMVAETDIKEQNTEDAIITEENVPTTDETTESIETPTEGNTIRSNKERIFVFNIQIFVPL